MTRTVHSTGLAVTVIGLFLVAPIVAANDAFYLNHYILDCNGNCRELQNNTPVVGGPRPALNLPIGAPGAVITDAFGNVYFASPGVVFKLDAEGTVTRIAGTGTPGFSGDGGPAQRAQLNNMPYGDYPEAKRDRIDFDPLVGGLALDVEGNLYIADAYNSRVRKVDTSGTITTVLGGADASMKWPQGVAVSSTGQLYVVVDYGPAPVFRLAPDGTVAKLTDANCGPDFLGPGLCGGQGIALDSMGSLYAADGYCRVRKMDPDGSFVTVAGDDTDPDGHGFAFTCGYNGDTGKATKTALAWPYGVAVDDGGDLLVADTFNHCIRRVDASGNMTTIAGSCGNPGYAGDGGVAKGALFNRPYGIGTDHSGNIFIADSGNYRIRKISPNGTITTVAGNGQAPRIDAAALANYQGLWWNSPANSESGWGVNLAHQGDIILASWFTYDGSGKGWWLVATMNKTGNGTYAGDLYTVSGARFDAFNPANVTPTKAGTATLTFTDANNGSFNYVIGAVNQTKTITRETFGTLPTCTFGAVADLTTATNYQDLWWNKPANSESGWGINLNHQGDTIFATWFTYDIDGTPLWLVVTANKTGPGVYSGDLYRTSGARFDAFNPASVTNAKVGTAMFTFADGNDATFDYIVQLAGMAAPVHQQKQITREIFTAPGTTCH